MIHELCDVYEHARFNRSDFQEVEYNQLKNLLDKCMNILVAQ